MPSFDAGYYQFTSLIPLCSGREERALWNWNGRPGSPADSLRELLSHFPSVDGPEGNPPEGLDGWEARAIPFSGSDRTHFARLVVVEDVAYNGRLKGDTLIELLRGFLQRWIPQLTLPVFDPVDHLPRACLLVLLDFDCPDGSRTSVKLYLRHLWDSMQQEWTLILRHCSGFGSASQDPLSAYLDLMLRYEIESTFNYAIYPWGSQRARRWQPGPSDIRPGRPRNRLGLLVRVIGIPVLELFIAGALVLWKGPGLMLNGWFLALFVLALLVKPLVWQFFLKAANAPWPAEAGSDLRSVLKALYLQERFLHLAESWQYRPPGDSSSVRQHFRRFLRDTQPQDLHAPSLKPGTTPRPSPNPAVPGDPQP